MQSLKYGRTYHFPFSPGTTSDDKIQSDWQQILQHELVITEKLDGENTCIKSDGIYARSHVAPTQNPWAKNMWEIWERVRLDLHDLEVFGENLYGLHSIEYQRLSHYFYIFAIRYQDTWLSWDDVVFYAQILDLPTVPVYKIGHFDEKSLLDFILNNMQEGSRLGDTIEGFVVRNCADFSISQFSSNVLKYVRKNHVQTDEHWTRNWRRAKLEFEYNKNG